MDNIVLLGSSGHAKVILDIVEKAARYRVAGLIDSTREIGGDVLGYRVLGREHDLPELIRALGVQGIILAIGDNYVRSRAAARIAELCPALPFVSAVHPAAAIGRDATLGPGTVVMAGAVVNPGCRIGESCIVNTNASLDHDSVMADFSSLAPGVTTGGNCAIGSHSAVSIGAVLRHGVTVAEHSVIGAGSLVLDDIDPYCVAYGIPAKKVRERQKGDRYL